MKFELVCGSIDVNAELDGRNGMSATFTPDIIEKLRGGNCSTIIYVLPPIRHDSNHPVSIAH